jgi:hypothetical protein
MKTIAINDDTKLSLDDISGELKAKLLTSKVSYDTVLKHLIQNYREKKP